MKEVVISAKGDQSGEIEELIEFLNIAKTKGATNYQMVWSGDPRWTFKWFELYRVKSEEELKQEEIKRLEDRLNKLKE